ncbi:uncharacterized protein LOC119066202 [Bradysia coprophila]|uniref:uncharacterized protein LOC119066202 n=1 Tax=Bradysia coprophila TaxID=38358 RepID=UPI00187D6E95|nr:uncharacterized protein LOC119066202 [Bradysia coprophila]
MDELDNLMKEAAKNVTAATEHANNVSSYTSQLKLQLSKTQELHSPETSSALKKTAQTMFNLVAINAKDSEDADVSAVSFLEFKSNVDERLASIDGILTAVGCIMKND